MKFLLLITTTLSASITNHTVDGASFSLFLPKNPKATIILANGLQTGRKSLELIGDPHPYAIIAYEYPAVIKELSLLKTIPTCRALLSVPSQLAQIAKWAKEQPWNTSPPVMMGVSLGAVFIPAAYHVAKEPLGPTIMAYGGADIYELLKANLDAPAFVCWILSKILSPLEPAKYLADLPGPTLIINGSRDEQIPQVSVEKLQELTPEPKTIITIDSTHLTPENSKLIQEIVRISTEWLSNHF